MMTRNLFALLMMGLMMTPVGVAQESAEEDESTPAHEQEPAESNESPSSAEYAPAENDSSAEMGPADALSPVEVVAILQNFVGPLGEMVELVCSQVKSVCEKLPICPSLLEPGSPPSPSVDVNKKAVALGIGTPFIDDRGDVHAKGGHTAVEASLSGCAK